MNNVEEIRTVEDISYQFVGSMTKETFDKQYPNHRYLVLKRDTCCERDWYWAEVKESSHE